MKAQDHRYGTRLGTGMIVVGVVLLGVAFVLAFGILTDPGGYYDEWVPDEGVAGPEASYDWTSAGLDVQFVDTSQSGDGSIEGFIWDFGDGAVSSEPEPTHRFADAGERTVTLEVVDANDLSSRAEGTVEIEAGAENSGEGAIGLSDLADNLAATVERSAKGGMVVVLVIGMLVVLTMIGGRVIRQGVRMLRPLPDRITMKLKPKELELAAADSTSETEPQVPDFVPGATDDRVEAGV